MQFICENKNTRWQSLFFKEETEGGDGRISVELLNLRRETVKHVVVHQHDNLNPFSKT